MGGCHPELVEGLFMCSTKVDEGFDKLSLTVILVCHPELVEGLLNREQKVEVCPKEILRNDPSLRSG